MLNLAGHSLFWFAYVNGSNFQRSALRETIWLRTLTRKPQSNQNYCTYDGNGSLHSMSAADWYWHKQTGIAHTVGGK